MINLPILLAPYSVWTLSLIQSFNNTAHGVVCDILHFQNDTHFQGTCMQVRHCTYAHKKGTTFSQMLNSIMYRFLTVNFTQTGQ
jgi:hypothetical protein